jgi:signal transduction histidine kinase
MTTYDPSILEGIQLVDARLALAKVRKEKTALFVIKTFGDDVEKAEIVQQKAVVCLNEAQRCVDDEQDIIASLQTAHRHLPLPRLSAMVTMPTSHQTLLQTRRFNTTSLRVALPQVAPSRLNELKAEVEKRQEEFDEAKAVLDDLKNSKTSKAEAEAQLTRAEKWHRMGKRIHDPRKNIIPHKDYQISWKPKDMGYGMNFN